MGLSVFPVQGRCYCHFQRIAAVYSVDAHDLLKSSLASHMRVNLQWPRRYFPTAVEGGYFMHSAPRRRCSCWLSVPQSLQTSSSMACSYLYCLCVDVARRHCHSLRTSLEWHTPALYSLGLCVGSPVVGVVADHMSSRRLPFLAGLVALALSTLLLCLGRTVAQA